MPFLHELTGMWVQAAACADVLDDFIHQNGTMPSTRASENPHDAVASLVKDNCTSHALGDQPRAGRRCPFALFELCQCGRICAEIFRALLGHAIIGAGTAGRAPVAVFKAGRRRLSPALSETRPGSIRGINDSVALRHDDARLKQLGRTEERSCHLARALHQMRRA
jgi:hypothetical protein